ncbi:MAG: 3-deoxy-D-manno-octulosonic-acid kinase [Caulobacter sp.]|nr:3-deoxy-D-manno-octulosonic-acid kinase [Caulobacter sp.]
MRKIKRWWRSRKAEAALKDRREAVQAMVAGVIGSPVRLKERGNLGHDSNYDVFVGTRQVAVLRLVNPFKQRPNPPPGMPFQIEDAARRLDHEYVALARAASIGLAPAPLWRAEDAILCSYLPYETLTSVALKAPDRVWECLSQASAALDRLHREVGMAHMDASLSNVLADAGRKAFALVDFEYTPVPGVGFAEQKIYDHLRLLQATGKFIPGPLKGEHAAWFAQFGAYVDDEMRAAPLERILPALNHVLGVEAYREAARRILPQLD